VCEQCLLKKPVDELGSTGRGKAPALVNGPTAITAIEQASVCFYGQKPPNLIDTASRALCSSTGPAPFRIYTLAGIPMMMKLIDHRVQIDGVRGIDAVFDVKGQKPHDVVPGAFIAIKGGATMTDLSGVPINEVTLEQSLKKPASEDSELRYVLAATDKLCRALQRQL
jgi:hypothetical protein